MCKNIKTSLHLYARGRRK